MNKHLLALFLVCLSISSLTGFELLNVLATPAPTTNLTCEPGGCNGSLGQACTDNIWLDGTTPIDTRARQPQVVGTAGQDISTFITSILANNERLCFSGQTFIPHTPIIITNQNVMVQGVSWSFTEPGFFNPVNLNLPSTVFQPASDFPANKYVFQFNNVNTMIIGCGLDSFAFDGANVNLVSNVSAILVANAGGCRFTNFAIMDKFTGDGIDIDQQGATYGSPSVSQLWFDRFIIWDLRGYAIFFDNSFISETFVSHFMIGRTDKDCIFFSNSDTRPFDMHIENGYCGASTTNEGMRLTINTLFMNNVFIESVFNIGLYINSTANVNGRKSYLNNLFIRDPDKNANGSPGILFGTGTKDYVLTNTMVWHDTAGEVGIQVADTWATFIKNGNYIDPNTVNATGFTTANFKVGGTNFAPKTIPSQASGSATISSSTSVVVSHGMVCTPSQVQVTPQSLGYTGFDVNTVGATQFTISVTTSGTYTFYWKANC